MAMQHLKDLPKCQSDEAQQVVLQLYFIGTVQQCNSCFEVVMGDLQSL